MERVIFNLLNSSSTTNLIIVISSQDFAAGMRFECFFTKNEIIAYMLNFKSTYNCIKCCLFFVFPKLLRNITDIDDDVCIDHAMKRYSLPI